MRCGRRDVGGIVKIDDIRMAELNRVASRHRWIIEVRIKGDRITGVGRNQAAIIGCETDIVKLPLHPLVCRPTRTCHCHGVGCRARCGEVCERPQRVVNPLIRRPTGR